MNSITQDMRFRRFIVRFSFKYDVSRASGKYNKARFYIYFWRKRYDGSIESLTSLSRKSHPHPHHNTQAEIKLIGNMCRRNPKLSRVELWCRLRKRGYNRYRVLKKLCLQPVKPKKVYHPKPYEQMAFPGERVQIDIKVVRAASKAGDDKSVRLVRYTAINEYSRLRCLKVYNEQSTFGSQDFLLSLVKAWTRKGIEIHASKPTTDSNLPIV